MAEITKPDYSYIWASGGAIIAPSASKIQIGWTAEIPPHQWENWSQNRQDNAIAYLFQRGIAEWDATTEYFENKSVTLYDGNLYVAIQDSVNQTPAPNSDYWASFVLSTNAQDAGEIKMFARSTAPTGYLKANGDAVLRSLYPNLDTAIYVGDANNATAPFGYRCTNPASPSTSRSTTGQYIVLPDVRGEFPRFWDDGRGVDTNRSFGSAQGHALLTHNHTGSTNFTGSHSHTGNTNNAQLTGNFNSAGSDGLPDTGIALGEFQAPTPISSMYAEPHRHSFTTNLAGDHSHTLTINNYIGANETRPRNIAFLGCIKY